MVMTIYLDHAATTPILPDARAAMLSVLDEWANPSSPHTPGRRARAGLEAARRRIADALGWAGDVILTSGASEAIALAMTAAVPARRLASTVEHDAVRRHVGAGGWLPVDGRGAVRLDAVALADALVAVQHVNSETGVIQPVAAIGPAIRAAGGLWLCDCTQSAGRLPLPDADLIAVGAHKLGGPVGAGALLVRDPAMLRAAGGQEMGYRGGTENWPAVAGFAAALEADAGWLDQAGALRQRIDDAVTGAGGHIVADGAPRLPTIASYRMPGVSARAQLIRFDAAGFAISAGSACASGTLKPSPVLAAMGWPAEAAAEVVRVSFGWTTTAADVEAFIARWRMMARGGTATS